jgi:hypothetical protein
LFVVAASSLAYAQGDKRADERLPSAPPGATREEVEQLRREVAELKAAIQRLVQTNQQAAGGARLVEVSAVQPEGSEAALQAGWNGEHFFVKSADGAFNFQPYGYVQTDYRAYSGDGHPPNTFTIRRARIGFQGALGKHYDGATGAMVSKVVTGVSADFTSAAAIDSCIRAGINCGDFRADETSFDPRDNILLVSNGDPGVPFVTLIDTTNPTCASNSCVKLQIFFDGTSTPGPIPCPSATGVAGALGQNVPCVHAPGGQGGLGGSAFNLYFDFKAESGYCLRRAPLVQSTPNPLCSHDRNTAARSR